MRELQGYQGNQVLMVREVHQVQMDYQEPQEERVNLERVEVMVFPVAQDKMDNQVCEVFQDLQD